MSPAALPGGGFPLGGKALGAGDGSISRASACLAGRAILVTRPAHQSAALADLIARDVGEAVLFPTIDILPATDPRPLAQAVAARDGIGLAIFTSANAVTLTLPALLAAGGLPPNAGAAAIGEGTAAALVSFGVTNVVIPPTGADTESLPSQSAPRPGHASYGLQHVRERLQALYGAEGSLSLEPARPKGTCAVVRFPRMEPSP